MPFRRPTGPLILCSALAAALCVTDVTTANAKSKSDLSYPFEQVWPTALRLLRIDRGYTIVEKDVRAGYIVFRYPDDDKSFHASLEIARIKDGKGRLAVRVFLNIRSQPRYVEAVVLSRLERKLRAEYGEPAPPPPKPKPTPPEDKKPDKDRPKNPENSKESDTILRENP